MRIIILSMLMTMLPAYSMASKTKETKKSSIDFFKEKNKKIKSEFRFNRYENLISGLTAFTIGNIGYITSNSEVLKLTYSGIQTIGLINIGRSIYKMHSPSINKRFEKFVTDENVNSYSRKDVADELVDIYGREDRAERLSLFYSSSILAAQYFLNTLVYETPEALESTYLFLGGVNTIVAIYSALYKSDYEKHLFGDDLDLNPFFFGNSEQQLLGLNMTYRF